MSKIKDRKSEEESKQPPTTIISAPHLLRLPPTVNAPTIPVIYSVIMAIRLTFRQAFRIKMSMLVILLVVYHNSIRNRNYLHRQSILHPHLSPWRRLMDYGDDSSFLHITGLTRYALPCCLMLLFHLGIPSTADARVANGHCLQMGNWVCCCFIWVAQ